MDPNSGFAAVPDMTSLAFPCEVIALPPQAASANKIGNDTTNDFMADLLQALQECNDGVDKCLSSAHPAVNPME